MSAQYRPYRDEESVDGMEAITWSDNEPGSIQIYEKTTEELPFNSNNRRALWVQIAFYSMVGLLGFLLGFFGSFHQRDLASPEESELHASNEHFDLLEDPTIKNKILNQIDGNNILAILNKYKDTNRVPGSNTDHEFAQHIHDSFNEFGFDPITSSNYTFKAMLPKKPTAVKLIDKDNNILYSNLDTEHYAHDDMRPFLPLSQAEETVLKSNQILYLNKGSKEDYAKLTNLGLNLNETEGKILVIRQTFYQAHDIVINAQESGAKAILLFPDPDTYGFNSLFPKTVQLPNDAGRSHPLAWSNYGDLASLNLSSLSGIDVSKLGLEKEGKIKIPVVPISFNTASKILRGLSGVAAPKEWNCFDFTLYLGPGYREENNIDKRDRIQIEFYNQETTITTTTVTGIIAGAIESDRYVVIGSRRDSLNRGVLDSLSGTSVMLEIARVFGVLLKQGWRPRRTIVFNSFGAESLNLIGSSNWLEQHQRLLHSRAVAYLNCDLIVTGNHTAAIAASPLLYQVLYNATKQVENPNLSTNAHLKSVYEAWKEVHRSTKSEEITSKLANLSSDLSKIFDEFDGPTRETGSKSHHSDADHDEDGTGAIGEILHEYRKSATIKVRPRVRRLDLQSIYSPFFLYAGIPVVDVRYAGYPEVENQSKANGIVEDMLPLIGTKYDNMETVQLVDPHLKYHVAVAQILSEILRDLSDSVYLPFNLLDYAVTLKDIYVNFVAHYGKTFEESNLELESLKQVIAEFGRAAIRFHHRQDQAKLRDALKVRKLNDQLMLLERAFLDPSAMPNYWERKHIILTPNDGQDHKEGFPGLVDWIALLEGDNLEAPDYSLFVEILKVQFKTVVYTISNAIRVIDEVHIL